MEPSPPAPLPPGRTTVVLLFALLCLIWGSTWLVIKGGLVDLPPYTSAAARFVLAAACMAAVAPWLRAREGGTRPPFWLSAILGVTNFAASYAIVYRTETLLPSGLTSVLWAVYPLLMATAGHWFLGERLRPVQGLGFLLGFAGVLVLFATDLADLGPAAAPAALILFLSPLVSAIGTVFVKRSGSGCSSVLLNRDGMAVGAVLLVLLALLLERDAAPRWSAAAIGSVVYLAVIGTCLSFGLWFWLLRYAQANQLSLIAFLTPAIALLLGWAVGGETIARSTLLGSGLVVFGVLLAGRKRRR